MGTAFTIAGQPCNYEPEDFWESFHIAHAAQLAAVLGLYPATIGTMRARELLARIDAALSHTPEQDLESILQRLRRVVAGAGELGVIQWS
jgi:hypothetical protein